MTSQHVFCKAAPAPAQCPTVSGCCPVGRIVINSQHPCSSKKNKEKKNLNEFMRMKKNPTFKEAPGELLEHYLQLSEKRFEIKSHSI